MKTNEKFLLIIKSSGIGDGEPNLAETLMKLFLKMILESGNLPSRIICMNSGIFLTTEGSPVADILSGFHKKGTEILSCGTCLEYYRRTDKLVIGQATNMRDTVDAMLSFEKTVYA